MPRSKAVAKKSSEKPMKKSLHSQKVARKSAPVSTGVRKYRFKPGTRALREIKKYQKGTDLLIQKAPFQRKGTPVTTQSEPSSANWVKINPKKPRKCADSRAQPCWPCKNPVKQPWSTSSKTPTCAPSTPRESPCSPLISRLPAESEATSSDLAWSLHFIQINHKYHLNQSQSLNIPFHTLIKKRDHLPPKP